MGQGTSNNSNNTVQYVDKDLQKITQFFNDKGRIDSPHLERAFRDYAQTYPPPGHLLTRDPQVSKAGAIRFLRDLLSLYGLPKPVVLFERLESSELSSMSFVQFLSFFFEVKDGFDLSESLNTRSMAYLNMLDLGDEMRKHHKSKVSESLIDIEPSNVIVPVDETIWTPPAQRMAREWSLIFAALPRRDINACNLVCRFFRTVLFKYPPAHWRVANLSSLEQRTAANMGSTLVTFQRLRSICYLQVGVLNLGNMLSGDDLVIIFQNLSNLRSLTLMFCHLIHREDWPRMCNLPGSDSLQHLHLLRVECSLSAISMFPRLTDLTLGQYMSIGASEFDMLLRPAAKCLIRQLRLGFSFINSDNRAENFLHGIKGLSLTHLYWHGSFTSNLYNEKYIRELLDALKPTLRVFVCDAGTYAIAQKLVTKSNIVVKLSPSIDGMHKYEFEV